LGNGRSGGVHGAPALGPFGATRAALGGTVRKRDHDRAIGRYERGIGVARVIVLLIPVWTVAGWFVLQVRGMDEPGQLILGTPFRQ
jgi:hypothetical protein